MAASLGIAAILSAAFLRSPAQPMSPGGDLLAMGLNWNYLTVESAAEVDQEVGYLLDTGSLSSFDEVTGEPSFGPTHQHSYPGAQQL